MLLRVSGNIVCTTVVQQTKPWSSAMSALRLGILEEVLGSLEQENLNLMVPGSSTWAPLFPVWFLESLLPAPQKGVTLHKISDSRVSGVGLGSIGALKQVTDSGSINIGIFDSGLASGRLVNLYATAPSHLCTPKSHSKYRSQNQSNSRFLESLV